MDDLVPLLEPSPRPTWHSQSTQMSLADESKANAGADQEEPKYESRTLAWLTLSTSIVVALAFVIAGVGLSRSKNRVAGSAAVHSIIPVISSDQQMYYGPEVMSAVFTVIATFVTESIGSVHSTALRSTLIDEYRLFLLGDTKTPLPPNAKHRFEFNTNSRLFAASNKRGWANPNGRLMNALMALLLVISYAASALIVTQLQIFEGPDEDLIIHAGIGLAAPPIIVFGLSLFLQGVISCFGAYRCGPYWLETTDMLATTKKQIDYRVIVPRPRRCMRNVLQGQSTLTTPDPLKPSARQPSAWSANRTVRKAVIVVWGLIPVYTIWGAIVYTLSVNTTVLKSGNIETVGIGSEKLSEFSWAFLPNVNTQSFAVAFLTTHAMESASLPSVAWPSILLSFMAIQSGLTLALHYCEAIIHTAQDEDVWRQAVGNWGASTLEQGFMRGLFVGALGTWRSVFILVTKFFCHWLFAQSFQVSAQFKQGSQPSGASAGLYFLGMEVIAHCAQIWYLSVVLVGIATIITLIANYKPRGPQPAAYGHFQTLADLIDEWYPVVYWGHKWDKDGICHAGTHYEPLTTPLYMDSEYAGELDQKSSSTANVQSE